MTTKTYIPKQPRIVRERLELKLERSLLQKLDQYCQFLESDRDYVIATVLQKAFMKDKGFVQWLAAQPLATAGRDAGASSGRRTEL